MTKDTILLGDALEVLRGMLDESVHCCITSPPYWGLRDYGIGGQLGLEKTPEEYVAKMVNVFREVRRVLRNDGTLWLNLGDSYAGGARRWGGYENMPNCKQTTNPGSHGQGVSKPVPNGLKPKDLVGIPWRVAFALQADGWYLRSDIIWAKPNPMPESVRDRPTRAHEYIFLMSKNAKYYYDAEAVREWGVYAGPNGPGTQKGQYAQGFGRWTPLQERQRQDKQRGHSRRHAGFNDRWDLMSREEQCALKRNKRSVWTVATQPFTEAHFAVFPPALVEPMVKAGCPEGGIVLDPFFGAGTVGLVAKDLGRHYIGIELNPGYIDMAKKRIGNRLPMEAQP